MVPLLFAPYAALAADRAQALAPRRVLETAAGTGILTEALHRVLPDAELVATDLNPPMLDQAARRVGGAVRFQTADALDLPFAESSFDLVACQFGAMFFPDKVRGHAEARRVLRDGGHYLLLIWDRLEMNLASLVAGQAVAELMPADAAGGFLERVPFRYHDPAVIEHDLRAAGFTKVALETVALRSRLGSAQEAATALVQGTPVRAEIELIDPALLAPATAAAAAALRQFDGPGGFDAPMSAHLVIATR
jgi:ubiquinone/menaquinone biosynthesis C-methylase UbiE